MKTGYKELTFTNDFLFCKILQNDEELCKEIVETLLDVRIREVIYLNKHEGIDITSDGRGVSLDVYLEGDASIYDIEMQMYNPGNLPKRSRYYQGIIDVNNLERGDSFSKLKKTYIVFICPFDSFGLGYYRYTFENRCTENLNLQLDDDAVKVFINAKGKLDKASPKLQDFLNYIASGRAAGDLSTRIDSRVRDAKDNKKWEVEYMTLDWKFEEKYKEGLEEGRAEGLFSAIKTLMEKYTPDEIIAMGFSEDDVNSAISTK